LTNVEENVDHDPKLDC